MLCKTNGIHMNITKPVRTVKSVSTGFLVCWILINDGVTT